ncbi:MAG: hypothetical protein ABJF86_14950 [Tateyamaria sp.]
MAIINGGTGSEIISGSESADTSTAVAAMTQFLDGAATTVSRRAMAMIP